MENREIIIGADVSKGELMHYGRKGMKWGQHIFGKVQSANTKHKEKKAEKAEKKKAEEAADRQKRIDSGKIKPKDMTDDELRARKERLQMERDVKELQSKTKVASKGAEFVKSAAMGPGKKIFWDTSVDVAAQTFKTVEVDRINKFMEEHGFGAEVVFTNNKRK